MATEEKHWKQKAMAEKPHDLTLSPMLWQFFSARGIQSKETVEYWLQPRLSQLQDPKSLYGMDQAVQILVDAFTSQKTIGIYADYDMDGTPGLALFYEGLETLGFQKLISYQPKRLKEGYGVHSQAIEGLKNQGVDVLITIDVGISDVKSIQRAKDLGMEVIITDHHLPQEVKPPADVILNPNQEECHSGLGHLCGAGVAFFFLLALRREFQEKSLGNSDFDPKELLDCFTIATLTDMVPLVKENRALVKHGLSGFQKTKRPGLRFLLERLKLMDSPLGSQDIAIRFAPKLNALSRMENSLSALEVFLEKDEEKAKALVDDVLANHEERVERQKKAEEEAFSQLKDWPHSGFVWVFSENFHKGVIGLIATRLSQFYGVPAFVGSQNSEGVISGSARIPGDMEINLLDVLDHAKNHLSKHGGHAAAAGFELQGSEGSAFKEALVDFFKQREDSVEKTTGERIFHDGAGHLRELVSEFMKWYDHLQPFGCQFEAPVFVFEKLFILETRVLKEKYLKVKVGEGKLSMDAIWFSPGKEWLEVDGDALKGQYFDILAEPQWNYFMGRKSVQLLISDIKKSGSLNAC